MKTQLKRITLFSLVIVVVLFFFDNALGLADTPPMGWNSWDSFEGSPTEDQFHNVAESFLKILAPHGYEYLLIDAGWYAENSTTVTSDGNSRLIPSPSLWPSSIDGKGFKPIADYVHSLGLKFGFHVMRGIHKSVVDSNQPILGTEYHAQDIAIESDQCIWWTDWYGVNMSHPAGAAYYQSIIDLYSSWGADYIKVDCIFAANLHMNDIIAISDSITKTDPNILLSLSPGASATPQLAAEIGKYVNMYRITQDFWDCYEPGTGVCKWCSNVLSHLQVLPNFTSAIGAPGKNGLSWPDADMLPFGYIIDPQTTTPVPSRFTSDEQTLVMTLWVMNRSPLILGGDPTRLDGPTTALLTNDEVLSITLKSSGNTVVDVPNTDFVVYKATGEGLVYAAIFNPYNSSSIQVDFQFSWLGITGNSCIVRDLWARMNVGSFSHSFSLSVPYHGARLFSLSGC